MVINQTQNVYTYYTHTHISCLLIQEPTGVGASVHIKSDRYALTSITCTQIEGTLRHEWALVGAAKNKISYALINFR